MDKSARKAMAMAVQNSGTSARTVKEINAQCKPVPQQQATTQKIGSPK